MECPGCAHDNIPGTDLCDECGFDLAGLDVQAWGVDADDPMLGLRISELPLKRALTLLPDATADRAIELMTDGHEGCLFVVDQEGGLLGVVSERDVALRLIARGRRPEETRLADIMTTGPFSLRPDDPLALALHRMGVDGYRHIPIVSNGKLEGFISMRTVLGVLAG